MEGVTIEMPIITAEEKAQRRLKVKAKRTLMMGIPNKHQLKFNSALKACESVGAFGGKLSQEDVNQNLLRSLSPEWNTHVVVWRNKVDLDTISMDDLYNNLKVTNGAVNIAQAVNTTQAINTSHGVSTASTQVNAAYSTNIDNLSYAVICSFFVSQPNSPQLVHEDLEQIHPDDMEEMDLRWKMAIAPRNQDNKHKENSRRSVSVEKSTSTALVSCDGLSGYDWSDQEEEGPNYALMAFSSSILTQRKFMPSTPDLSFTGLDEFVNKPIVENCKVKSSEEDPKIVKKNDDAPIIEEWVSYNKEEDVSQPKIEKKIVRASSGPDWLFDIDALTRTMNYEPIVAGTQSNSFASTKASDYADPKSSNDDGSKPSTNDGKKVEEDPRKEIECNDQEKEDNINNTNNVNTVSSTVNTAGTNGVNVVGGNISIELKFDPNMLALEDVSTFDFSSDDEDDGYLGIAKLSDNDTLNLPHKPSRRVGRVRSDGFTLLLILVVKSKKKGEQ
nr:hypothetical protein [Tanacetum cinerariifolium]